MKLQSRFFAWLGRSGWVVLAIAAVQFILHLWANAHDNFFRDELYYLAAAQHLEFGYVEFAPFVALVAVFSRAVLGSSVLAIRLLPALAGALMVLLTYWRLSRLPSARSSSALVGCSPWISSISCGGLWQPGCWCV